LLNINAEFALTGSTIGFLQFLSVFTVEGEAVGAYISIINDLVAARAGDSEVEFLLESSVE